MISTLVLGKQISSLENDFFMFFFFFIFSLKLFLSSHLKAQKKERNKEKGKRKRDLVALTVWFIGEVDLLDPKSHTLQLYLRLMQTRLSTKLKQPPHTNFLEHYGGIGLSNLGSLDRSILLHTSRKTTSTFSTTLNLKLSV